AYRTKFKENFSYLSDGFPLGLGGLLLHVLVTRSPIWVLWLISPEWGSNSGGAVFPRGRLILCRWGIWGRWLTPPFGPPLILDWVTSPTRAFPLFSHGSSSTNKELAGDRDGNQQQRKRRGRRMKRRRRRMRRRSKKIREEKAGKSFGLWKHK